MSAPSTRPRGSDGRTVVDMLDPVASSGGGLAAALCLRLRDNRARQPRLQLLIYPMLDDRDATPSMRAVADPGHPGLWHRAANRMCWAAYLGPLAGGDVPPTAAPARAKDLRGLAPAVLAIGDVDGFLDENLDYAKRLSRAGVPIELHVYPGSSTAGSVPAPAHRAPSSSFATCTAPCQSHSSDRALVSQDPVGSPRNVANINAPRRRQIPAPKWGYPAHRVCSGRGDSFTSTVVPGGSEMRRNGLPQPPSQTRRRAGRRVVPGVVVCVGAALVLSGCVGSGSSPMAIDRTVTPTAEPTSTSTPAPSTPAAPPPSSTSAAAAGGAGCQRC